MVQDIEPGRTSPGLARVRVFNCILTYELLSYGMPRILNLRLHKNLYFLVFYPNTEPTLLDFKLQTSHASYVTVIFEYQIQI